MRKHRVSTTDDFILEIECTHLEFEDGMFKFMHDPDTPIAIINKDYIKFIGDEEYNGKIKMIQTPSD